MWWAQLLNNIAALFSGGVAASTGSFESIATVTGTGSSTSITFSSIPSTYTSLQIRFTLTTTTGNSQPIVRVNSDTASNYAFHSLFGNGASAFAGGNATRTSMLIAGGSISSTYYFSGIIDIHNYASTSQNKTVRTFAGVDTNGGGNIGLYSGLWSSTAAINSITIDSGTAGENLTGTFALYGIKGA